MAAYIFLALSLICGAVKGFCGKKISSVLSEKADALFVNTVRMFLCIFIGIAIVIFSGNASGLRIDPIMSVICAVSGLANSAFVVFWMFAVRTNTYMMVEISGLMGCLVPTIGSFIFFNEKIYLSKFIGFILLIAAVIVFSGYNKRNIPSDSKHKTLFLILSGFSSGMLGFAQQLYKFISLKNHPEYTSDIFNFYTYLFAFIILGVFYFCYISRKKEGTYLIHAFAKIKRYGIYIFIMAIGLFLHSYFTTAATAANTMPSQVLYPMQNGCAMILSTLMANIFFKEKITFACISGIIIAFCGIVCINVLQF